MTRVNLLAPRLPSRGMILRRRLSWTVALLVLVMLASLSAYLWLLADLGILQAELAALEAHSAAEGHYTEQATALSAAIREMDGRAEVLALIPEQDERYTRLVVAIKTALPEGCQLEQVTMEADGALALTGTADSHSNVAALVDSLRTIPELAKVHFQSSTRPPEGGRAGFRLRGSLDRPADGSAEGGDAS